MPTNTYVFIDTNADYVTILKLNESQVKFFEWLQNNDYINPQNARLIKVADDPKTF